jgi:hypothetical protein
MIESAAMNGLVFGLDVRYRVGIFLRAAGQIPS